MQAVGDHQLDRGLARGLRHLLAFVLGHRHRLLAQHVHARARGAHGVLAVHAVRQRDVDRVDRAALQALVVLLVGVGAARRRTSCRELFALHRVAGDQRRQLGVAARLPNAGSTATWAMWPRPTTA